MRANPTQSRVKPVFQDQMSRDSRERERHHPRPENPRSKRRGASDRATDGNPSHNPLAQPGGFMFLFRS